MRENYGLCPDDAKGKRIRGVLRNGTRFGFEQAASAAPPGWSAETTCWSVAPPHPFDVLEFEVIS